MPDETPADDLTPTRVYNRSRHNYIYDIYPKNEKGYAEAHHLLAPQAFTTVPQYIADELTKKYPDDLLAGDTARAIVDPNGADAAAAAAKVAELEDEKAQLQLDVEALKAQLAAATAPKQ